MKIHLIGCQWFCKVNVYDKYMSKLTEKCLYSQVIHVGDTVSLSFWFLWIKLLYLHGNCHAISANPHQSLLRSDTEKEEGKRVGMDGWMGGEWLHVDWTLNPQVDSQPFAATVAAAAAL